MLRLSRRLQPRGYRCSNATVIFGRSRHHSTWTGNQHDPLNILFCGADGFSIYSLRALRELQDRRPEKIASIDVVCRPDKYVGRGLKQVQEGKIKEILENLGG